VVAKFLVDEWNQDSGLFVSVSKRDKSKAIHDLGTAGGMEVVC
jgi:hypothetical protein